jgi:hypothetical protein
MADDKQSGGVNAQAGNDMNVSGDASGRDKITTQTTVSLIPPDSNHPISYTITGLVIVAVIAGLVIVAVLAILVLALTRPASPTSTGPPTTQSTLTMLPTLTELAEQATLPNLATPSAPSRSFATVTAISPIKASTPIATGTLTLVLTRNPTAVPSLIPSVPATQSVTPFTNSPTAIKPANRPGVGTLDVRVALDGCNDFTYDVISNNNLGTSTGRANTNKQIAVGTYTITLKSPIGEHFGNQAVQAVIQQGKTTAIDFTPVLGKLRINGYPQVGAPSYRVSPGGNLPRVADFTQCGSVGQHTVTFEPYSPCYGGYGFYCNSTTLALFPEKVSVQFDVEVKAGETAIVGPEVWPYQLGLLTFLPAITNGQAQIEDLQNNVQFTRSLNNNTGQYWMLVGKYKITLISQPFTGTTYEFEIKAGEQTVLQSPQ